jgi:hypothetical protein
MTTTSLRLAGVTMRGAPLQIFPRAGSPDDRAVAIAVAD